MTSRDVSGGWTYIDMPQHTPGQPAADAETMEQRITRVKADQSDLYEFHNIDLVRPARLKDYYVEELDKLHQLSFEELPDQEARVDYVLLRNYLRRSIRRLELDEKRNEKMAPLLPFAAPLVELLEARQKVELDSLKPRHTADVMDAATRLVLKTKEGVESGKIHVDGVTAIRAVSTIEQLQARLAELIDFFKGYHPTFDWWTAQPYEALNRALADLIPPIKVKLAGQRPGEEDAIVGQPIGRDGLLVDLEAEMISYTPEELLKAAEEKFAWCEDKMRSAAARMGFGDDWHAALEHVKNLGVEPGEQPAMVKRLVVEGADYVERHGLVTVPPLARRTWRMYMMAAERQKVNPFFLGGPEIIVSYPTAAMAHGDKLMSIRGNNRHFAKATAFHEMIPGHHLAMFHEARHRAYRALFENPFWVEGWAMYWELVLWDRGDFFDGPEDEVGTLWWRMHRCARILFSLGYHLGRMSAQDCVELLVARVGHERRTAEGEVRRSLNGDYEPLYQAGYYLGALQIYSLRDEVLRKGICASEREFNDRILRENEMPIEMLRALFLDVELSKEYKAQWRFLD
ncbi:uncharacterized protein E0L32_005253 [Thyridium curvatum]|uniref:X-Pro dipeptidyl-peptidase n=1 Tax=Thyridium curvatum TaxID=1093900 RepID=A0A507BC73_9PEZI|nr:uncharacterized protein E0L32_005253 [Thyridium curvatum]TPX14561.1 hypothetical protein E0L32_005253 [Thyridium curvatum]